MVTDTSKVARPANTPLTQVDDLGIESATKPSASSVAGKFGTLDIKDQGTPRKSEAHVPPTHFTSGLQATRPTQHEDFGRALAQRQDAGALPEVQGSQWSSAAPTTGERIQAAGEAVKGTVSSAAKTVKDTVKDAVDTVRGKAAENGEKVKEKAEQVKDKAQKAGENIKDKAEDNRETIKQRSEEHKQNIKQAANDAHDAAKNKWDAAVAVGEARSKQVTDTLKDTQDAARDNAQHHEALADEKVKNAKASA